MADNYLEKREEELRRGKPSVRLANPSLDTLITRISGHTEATDTSYVVKEAQLEAITRSADRLRGECSLHMDEASASIQAHCREPFILGQKVLAMELKAAELKLSCRIEQNTSETVTLTLYR